MPVCGPPIAGCLLGELLGEAWMHQARLRVRPAPTHPRGVQELKPLRAPQAHAEESLLCESCLVYGAFWRFFGAEAASLNSVSSLWAMVWALSPDVLGFCISSNSLGTFWAKLCHGSCSPLSGRVLQPSTDSCNRTA